MPVLRIHSTSSPLDKLSERILVALVGEIESSSTSALAEDLIEGERRHERVNCCMKLLQHTVPAILGRNILLPCTAASIGLVRSLDHRIDSRGECLIRAG